MPSVRELDFSTAQLFYAQDTALEEVENYLPEMDSEVRSDAVKAAMYVIYRKQGLLPFYADLAACRRAPGAAGVDRHFSEKARSRMSGMSQANLSKIIKLAQQAGISTQGKFYVGGLGRYTDPAAWCATADDVLTAARKKNFNVTGAVKHQAVPVEASLDKRPSLAPDIVQRKVRQVLSAEPQTAEKVRKNPKHLQEVKERVIEKHAPKRRIHG